MPLLRLRRLTIDLTVYETFLTTVQITTRTFQLNYPFFFLFWPRNLLSLLFLSNSNSNTAIKKDNYEFGLRLSFTIVKNYYYDYNYCVAVWLFTIGDCQKLLNCEEEKICNSWLWSLFYPSVICQHHSIINLLKYVGLQLKAL